MKILYIDFDGVIIDSLDECFNICFKIISENSIINKKNFYLFFKNNRYLVNPPSDYLVLCNIYLKFPNITKYKCLNIFRDYQLSLSQKDRISFTNTFFKTRKLLQNENLLSWYKMNQLTFFAKKISNNNNFIKYIISTKNYEAINMLCNHYKFEHNGIFGYEEYIKYNNKSGVIKSLINKHKKIKSIFLDDSPYHLGDVQKNTNLKCIFAHWGYGVDNHKFPRLKLNSLNKKNDNLIIKYF